VIPLESVNGFPSIGSGILNTANGSGGWSATDLIHSYTVSTLNSLQIDWPEGIPGGGKTANILIGNNSQNITASVGRPSGVETNEIIFNSGLSGINLISVSGTWDSNAPIEIRAVDIITGFDGLNGGQDGLDLSIRGGNGYQAGTTENGGDLILSGGIGATSGDDGIVI